MADPEHEPADPKVRDAMQTVQQFIMDNDALDDFPRMGIVQLMREARRMMG
jgi:hypothetical protein